MWRCAAVACGVLLTACGSPKRAPVAMRPVQQTSAREASPQEDADQEALADRVTGWALGDSRRMVRRKSRAAGRLLVLPRQGPGRPLTSDCMHASSFLPSRAEPGTVFMVVDGALHVFDVRAPRPAIVPITTVPAGVVFMQLLASSKAAPPTELLALVQPPGKQDDASARLWRLVITGERATGKPVLDGPWLRSREAFFEYFSAPRCREDGSDCLVITNGDHGGILDVQPRPRAPRSEWRTLGESRIHDVSWNPAANPADEGSALALVTCEKKAP